MSSTSDDDQHWNRPGMRFYRQRLINRARTVSQDSAFRERVRQVRREWNEEYPQLRIPTFETLDEFDNADTVEDVHIFFLPRGNRDYIDDDKTQSFGVLAFRWSVSINRICSEFWPDRLFPEKLNFNLRGNLTHPAFMFVQLCLYCDINEVAARVEEWFPEFKIHLHSLPYVPQIGDRWKMGTTEGERDFWKRVALKALSELRNQKLPSGFMEDLAHAAGVQYARKHGLSIMDQYQKPAEQMFWFLPISPLMSTRDVKSVTSDIVEMSRKITGPSYLDDLIMELKSEGMTHQAVAAATGISIDVVKRAVRQRPRRSGGEVSGPKRHRAKEGE